MRRCGALWGGLYARHVFCKLAGIKPAPQFYSQFLLTRSTHNCHRPLPNESKVYRGTEALQRGRWSAPGADYFITGKLERPLAGLATEPLAGILQVKLHEIEDAGHWHLRTFVLMPDHFHLLATLGEHADLSEVVRRFKGPLTPILRQHSLRWQKNFYDHRLRSADDLLPTFLYIFLNPYRARLIETGRKWPWYYCAPEDWEWFGGMTNEALPFPEWLQ
jgi:REP element-mobilizing transposase RayT